MHTNDPARWVTAWGNAVSIRLRRPENYGRDLTLRYPLTMMLDGDAVRITLDNFCGNEAVTLTCATVARSAGGNAVVPETLLPITFGGSRSVTIPAGEQVTSDAVSMRVTRGEVIDVSLYFADFTELRSAVNIRGPLSAGYFAVGDQTAAAVLPLDASNGTKWFYFLSGVEVLTTEDKHCLVCFGDSITAQDWPDYLMQRVLREGDGSVSVIRKAASGTRILRQYDNIVYDSYGLKGATRFPHEVPVPGADAVIIQHGINDIIHPVGTDVNPFRPWSDLPTAEELIEGLTQYIEWARSYGMRVYLGTLLPIEGWRTYAPFREELRSAVNDWMRTTDLADGCIDFDAAVRDPARPTAFAPGYDSGDHLHPSTAAYARMAEIVPAELFTGIRETVAAK